jgi:hypothetical protein
VAAFFGRRQLVFEMYRGGAGLNHGFHDLKSVQHPAKAGFGIGHNGREPIRSGPALQSADLVGPEQSVIDGADQRRHAIGRIEALVGVHLRGAIGVGCNLPAAHVDRL